MSFQKISSDTYTVSYIYSSTAFAICQYSRCNSAIWKKTVLEENNVSKYYM